MVYRAQKVLVCLFFLNSCLAACGSSGSGSPGGDTGLDSGSGGGGDGDSDGDTDIETDITTDNDTNSDPGDTGLDSGSGGGGDGDSDGDTDIETDITTDNDTSSDPGGTDTESDGGPTSGFEGFGAVTQGSQGCRESEVVEVTTLADSGPGSLRAALSAECRRVEFAVGGEILLESAIVLTADFVTIDGATAPSPGITLTKGSVPQNLLVVEGASDVIITNLRFIGLSTDCDDDCGDNLALAGVSRVVIDHVSSGHADDGALDIAWGWNESVPGWADSDVTVSWSLFYRTSKAMLIKYGPHRNLSLHHNVFARNTERNPQVRHQVEILDFVNNVIYLWGQEPGEWGYGMRIYDHDDDFDSDFGGDGLVDVNCIGNVFAPNGGMAESAIELPSGGGNGSRGDLFFDDNVVPAQNAATLESTVSTAIPIPTEARVTTFASAELGGRVAPFVGTQYPTPEEQALIDEVVSAIE